MSALNTARTSTAGAGSHPIWRGARSSTAKYHAVIIPLFVLVVRWRKAWIVMIFLSHRGQAARRSPRTASGSI
eukprot:8031333-Pyramimonas_sp.AAC.1